MCLTEKIEKFLDGPGNIEENREKKLGRNDFLDNRPLLITFILAVIASLFFYFFPRVDLGFTSLFYEGNGVFPMVNSDLGHFFHVTLVRTMIYFLIGLGALYIIGEIRRKPLLTLTRRRVIFIGLCIAISAGLVTNVMFKNNWGRARPRDVVEFNGTKQFTPAGVIADQCKRNCSFVSGESSFAFSFLCFPLLARAHRRKWFLGVLVFASSVGFMRVAMGAHFLSDSLLAGFYTLLVILLIERFLLSKCQPPAYSEKTFCSLLK